MIRECLNEERILLAPGEPDYRHLIERMLKQSAQIDAADIGQVCDRVLERDQRMPTALGKGIAVPRCISDRFGHNEIIAAIDPAGLPAASSDPKPVRILFLLLLSIATAYADVLAQCLRLLNDEAVKEELLRAKDAPEVCRIVQRWEQD
jgi:mannitol/fructose-specific phosphotransferase system IIA component (Ntr-type)